MADLIFGFIIKKSFKIKGNVPITNPFVEIISAPIDDAELRNTNIATAKKTIKFYMPPRIFSSYDERVTEGELAEPINLDEFDGARITELNPLWIFMTIAEFNQPFHYLNTMRTKAKARYKEIFGFVDADFEDKTPNGG